MANLRDRLVSIPHLQRDLKSKELENAYEHVAKAKNILDSMVPLIDDYLRFGAGAGTKHITKFLAEMQLKKNNAFNELTKIINILDKYKIEAKLRFLRSTEGKSRYGVIESELKADNFPLQIRMIQKEIDNINSGKKGLKDTITIIQNISKALQNLKLEPYFKKMIVILENCKRFA